MILTTMVESPAFLLPMVLIVSGMLSNSGGYYIYYMYYITSFDRQWDAV